MKKNYTVIKMLTLAEVASILKISKRTLHRMIQHRQIPAFKVGGQWRLLESRIQEWVREEGNFAHKESGIERQTGLGAKENSDYRWRISPVS